MSNTNIIIGLNSLLSVEWSSFRKFILNKCAQDSNLGILFQAFYKMRKKTLSDTDSEKVKTKYFDSMSNKVYSNLLSSLFIEFQEWLIQNEVNKNEIKKQEILIDALNNKGLYKMANQKFEQLKKSLENSTQYDLIKNQSLYEINDLQYFSDNPFKYKLGVQALDDLVDYHWSSFEEQAVFYCIELYNWGNIQNHDFSIKIDQYKSILQLRDPTSITKIGQSILKIIEENNVEEFKSVCNTLFNEEIKLHTKTNTLITLYLIIQLHQLWSKGFYSDGKVALKLYNYAMRSGALFYKGQIPVIRFFNTITAISVFTSFEKTNLFIDDWIHKVTTDDTTSCLKLAKAINCFNCDKLDKILDLLQGRSFNNLGFKFRARTLELVAIFAQRKYNYNLFYDYLNNQKRLLNRNKGKVSKRMYKSYSNFVKVLELIAKRDIAPVQINLSNYKILIYRNWLSKQLKGVKP